MSFSEIRPLLSAMIGIAIAGWLKVKWARWVPAMVGTKGREQLLKEHRRSIWVANLLAFVGLFSGLLSFKSGWLNASDWRGLGLGIGLMCLLPLACLAAANAGGGCAAIKECMVAYAISQKTPPRLLFPVMGVVSIAGLISAVSLFL